MRRLRSPVVYSDGHDGALSPHGAVGTRAPVSDRRAARGGDRESRHRPIARGRSRWAPLRGGGRLREACRGRRVRSRRGQCRQCRHRGPRPRAKGCERARHRLREFHGLAPEDDAARTRGRTARGIQSRREGGVAVLRARCVERGPGAGGFEPGKIYEPVYRARDPVVVGIGLAAVRDMMSYAKYDAASLFPVRWGVGLGISQTGRFLRHFVYQGFNTDEARRPVFDGLFVHTAGAGRGSFNHRFAQPSRDAHRFSTFFYPTDIFPFAGRSQRDPETRVTDGLFAHEPNLPKIFFTNTGYEYWGRAASLIHVTPTGDADIEPLPNERVYHLAGGQHFVVDRPAVSEQSDAVVAYRGSPLDFHPALRSLLTRLVEWVRDGREPPPSAYPRLDAGTLVAIDRVRAPAISGAAWPRLAHEAYRVDYGPRWPDGVITLEPPRLGKPFPVRVPPG